MDKEIIYKARRQFPKINYHRGKGAKPRVHQPEVVLELRLKKQEGMRTVDLDTVDSVIEVSLTCNVWNAKRTDCVMCGAGVERLMTDFFPHLSDAREIAALTKACHLNDMNSGTRGQQAVLAAYEACWDKYGRPAYIEGKDHVRPDLRCFHAESDNGYDHYGWACQVLKDAGLYVDRGYKYGHAWLVDVLPEAIIRRLVELFPNPSVNKLEETDATKQLIQAVAEIKAE